MHPEHAEIEKMSLPQLADRLADLDGRRTPVGWVPEDAVERATVERCILGLIAADETGGQKPMACNMEVKLRSKEQTVTARVTGIGTGGVRVEAPSKWVVGTHVEMQVRQDASDELGLRVRGIIREIQGDRLRISVAEQPSEGHERRLRRFIVELIRHRSGS
jgi:hypothetical protein